MRRAILACAVTACTPPPPVPPAPLPAPVATRADELAWVAGDPARTAAALRAEASPSLAQLVDLGRAEAALGRGGDADRAFAAAATASGAGTWHWQPASSSPICVTVSSDRSRVATCQDRVTMWDVATGDALWTTDPARALAFSRDGRWLASPSWVVDAATGRQVWTPRRRRDSVAFTPEGRLAVLAFEDHGPAVLEERELPSGRLVASHPAGHVIELLGVGRDRVFALQSLHHAELVITTRRGEVVATGPWDDDDHVVALDEGDTLVDCTGQTCSAFDRDGRRRSFYTAGALSSFAVAGAGGRLAARSNLGPDAIHIVDAATGMQIGLIGELGATGASSPGDAFGFDPRGEVIAVAGRDGISMYAVATGRRTHHLAATPRAYAVAFDPRGTGLAFGTDTGATLWSFARGAAVELATATPVVDLAYAPSGDLATLTQGAPSPPEIAYWPADTTTPRWTIHQLDEHLAFVGGELRGIGYGEQAGLAVADGAAHALAPGPTVHGWSAAGDVDIRDVDTATLLVDAAGEHVLWRDASVHDDAAVAAFAPDGARVAILDGRDVVSVWDVATAQPTAAWPAARSQRILAWSPRGDVIATASRGVVRLWRPDGSERGDTRAHVPASPADPPPANVVGVAFSPDGRLVAAARDDGRVELLAVATGARVATLASLGGHAIVLAGGDGDARTSGTLPDEVPFVWRGVRGSVPARGKWSPTHGLLAALLADAPTAAPIERAAPAVATSQACVPAGRRHLDTTSLAGDRLSVCVRPVVEHDGEDVAQPPRCFTLDLATGAYTPRPATPREVIGPRAQLPAPRGAVATVTATGNAATVCRDRRCRVVHVPELAAMAQPAVAVDDDGTRLAAVDTRYASATSTVLYDVARGTRLAAVAPINRDGDHDGVRGASFAGRLLLLSSTPCAGPCASTRIADARTGKLLPAVAGDGIFWVAAFAAFGGDVWALADGDANRVVIADVTANRASIVDLHDGDDRGAPAVALYEVERGVLVVLAQQRAGSAIVLARDGRVVAGYELPTCR